METVHFGEGDPMSKELKAYVNNTYFIRYAQFEKMFNEYNK